MESSPDLLTDESRFFLEPASPAHRQYEALRAYLLEGSPSQQVAERFGYSPGSFRDLVLAMCKQNLSIYDIERSLKDHDTPLSCTAIWEILHDEGFARLPRRGEQEHHPHITPPPP